MSSSSPMKKNPHAVGWQGCRYGQVELDEMVRALGREISKARQSRLPKLLSASFRGPGARLLRLPRDLEEVAMVILPNGTQAQKDLLCRMVGREAVVQVVRRWRGSFLHSKSQLLEWVSRGTVRRWARYNPELKLWSQAR